MNKGWNLNIIARPGYFIIGIYLDDDIRGSVEVRNADELEQFKRFFPDARITGESASLPSGISRTDIFEVE